MSRTLRLVIVEDEPISSAYLKKQIKSTGIDFQIVKELDSVSEALLFFSNSPMVDLVFMDIHLGDGTCFDLLNEIDIKLPIIFCTTYDNYAIRAFKYNSIDYLLKPTNQQEVKLALEKFMQLQQNDEDSYLKRIDSMMKSIKEPHYKKRFLIRVDGHQEIINTSKVQCFYSDEGQSYLVDIEGDKHQIDFTLERLEELIDPEVFFRINRKVMVSIDAIRAVEDYFNSRLKLTLSKELGFELLVSRNRVKEFKGWLKGLA